MHSQQPPGVVQNRSTLQCSKQNTERCGYDHAPVTRGRMRAQFPLPHGPLAPPTGFGTYINSALKTSMVRPGWGATSISGREWTRGCYALKQKYHLPCPPPPPPCFKKFSPTYMLRSDYRVEAVILCHVCQAMKPPPPPFLAAPLPPPRPTPPPPPRPENGPRVGGSRRMARRYGPPVGTYRCSPPAGHTSSRCSSMASKRSIHYSCCVIGP